MAKGLPELCTIGSDGAVYRTTEGSAILKNSNFRYLDFLRHQLNEQLHEAHQDKQRCNEALRNMSRNYEQGLREIDRRLAQGMDRRNVPYMEADLGWDTHPENVYWTQPYQRDLLNRIRVLEASRDLVVCRMNEIGSRG